MTDETKLPLTSSDVTAEILSQLREIAPQVFTEGRVDYDKLKATLGETIIPKDERYGLSWAGKSEAFRNVQTPSMGTLLPQPEKSINFANSENLIVEGDNLEVLKLLQKSYHGKVKLIYIDPPYNTGNEFIYPDNYHEGLDDYLKYSGQLNNEGQAKSSNTETSGRFHSKWLNMIYPRLFFARNLLRDDGVIFISIDDNELSNLLKVCEEIFGEENFVANIVWARKRGKDNSAKFLSRNHEYLIAFAKNIGQLKFNRLEIPEQTRLAYKNPDNDPRGDYRTLGLWARGSQGGSKFSYTTKTGVFLSEREWLVGEKTMVELDQQDKLIINGDKVYRKMFLDEYKGDIPETIWDDASNAANAADEIKALFGYQVFDTAKPIPYISKILKIATSDDDIILDFFAGSGSTAHAVMKTNLDDMGQRKFILVQLPEKTENPEYPTIADITRERVRRVIKKLESDYPSSDHNSGFRAFKLTTSNFKIWNADTTGTDAKAIGEQLRLYADNVEHDRTQQDILYELVLKTGLPLSAKVKEIEVAGKPVFSIAQGQLLICLEKEVSQELLRGMVALSPVQMVCLDRAFGGNDQLKTNTVLEAKSQDVTFRTV